MSWRREHEADRPVRLDGELPGLRRLVGVGRAHQRQPGHGPQRGQVLDRLVGRAVLAQADRVVGPRVDDVAPGERGQADGRAHVVGEDEEGPAHGQHAAVQGHAVHDRPHGELADAVVHLVAARGVRRLDARVLERHAVVAGQVGRAGQEAGQSGRGGVDALVDGVPGGQLGAGLEGRQVVGPAGQARARPGPPPRRHGRRPRPRNAPSRRRGPRRPGRSPGRRSRAPRRAPRRSGRPAGPGSPWWP